MEKSVKNSEKRAIKKRCKICKSEMIKWGKTKQGKQRWRCPECGKTRTIKKSQFSKRATFLLFISWILEQTVARVVSNNKLKSFHRKINWCWEITPEIPVTGEIYECILLDAMFIHTDLILLLARTPSYIIGYRFCKVETTEEWLALLSNFPQPKAISYDGGILISRALKEIWKNVEIQRCFWHLSRFAVRMVTQNPASREGRVLLNISSELLKVNNLETAKSWEERFFRAWKKYEKFICERTRREDLPPDKRADCKRAWWWTHKNLHRGWVAFKKAIEEYKLWIWLENKNVPRTNNLIEGGINSPIARLCRAHNGMTEDHQMKMIGWYLLKRSEFKIDGFLDSTFPRCST